MAGLLNIPPFNDLFLAGFKTYLRSEAPPAASDFWPDTKRTS
jgi:hypothetical protein